MGADSTRPSGAYSIHEAKTQFSKLIARAEAGEEIVIRRGPTPVARLVALAPTPRVRGHGFLKGRIWIAEDFDEFIPPEFEEYL